MKTRTLSILTLALTLAACADDGDGDDSATTANPGDTGQSDESTDTGTPVTAAADSGSSTSGSPGPDSTGDDGSATAPVETGTSTGEVEGSTGEPPSGTTGTEAAVTFTFDIYPLLDEHCSCHAVPYDPMYIDGPPPAGNPLYLDSLEVVQERSADILGAVQTGAMPLDHDTLQPDPLDEATVTMMVDLFDAWAAGGYQ